MSGVRLASLEADDMIDVLHYMFEEDMHVSSAEQVESISKSREIIYRELYGRDYKYSVTVNRNNSSLGEDIYPEDGFLGEEEIVPFNPDITQEKQESKGYIPPTEVREDWVKPFGLEIDEPLN